MNFQAGIALLAGAGYDFDGSTHTGSALREPARKHIEGKREATAKTGTAEALTHRSGCIVWFGMTGSLRVAAARANDVGADNVLGTSQLGKSSRGDGRSVDEWLLKVEKSKAN